MAVKHNIMFAVLLFLSVFYYASSKEKKCEEIKIPMCQSIGYNLTYMPNMFNHDTQEAADLEVNNFWPVVNQKCSPDLRYFLCSVYAPMCQQDVTRRVPPCRSLCKSARKGCLPLVRPFGLSWPERMRRCRNFPKRGSGQLCIGSKGIPVN